MALERTKLRIGEGVEVAGRVTATEIAGDGTLLTGVAGGISGEPPAGMHRVTRLYVNPTTGKLMVEYEI